MSRCLRPMKIDQGAGLYIHVPFCRTKCPYCDFYSEVQGEDVFSAWADAVAVEARMRSGFTERFDTVYLGGGTPSVLPSGLLAGLMSKLGRVWNIKDASELTIEINPDDLTDSLLEEYMGIGFNRVSLGIQSFDEKELRFLGRRHGAERALEAAASVMGAGFDGVSFDLINSLPAQTVGDWESSLARAVEIGPDHLSCYQLTFKSGTRFGDILREGEINEPDEEGRREIFLATSEFLRARGYEHYEVSNFAAGAAARSKHNSAYWKHRPYLGLGPSAHSFDGASRWWNVSSVKEYLSRLQEGREPAAGSERLSYADLMLEKLFLGLRTSDGVDTSVIDGYTGWENGVRRLRELSLVRMSGRRLVPTIEGYLLADSLPLYFV